MSMQNTLNVYLVSKRQVLNRGNKSSDTKKIFQRHFILKEKESFDDLNHKKISDFLY